MPAAFSYSPQAIALNRFGLGARPGDSAPARPRAALLDQLEAYDPAPPGLAGHLPGERFLVDFHSVTPDRDAMNSKGSLRESRKALAGKWTEAFRTAVTARIAEAVRTPAPFAERLVHFWSNHFCVSADNYTLASLVPSLENRAIRPHVMGRFADMLAAAEMHPAMISYLNQDRSVGPNSVAGKRIQARRDKDAGINENLAREILELHTLGVRSGYSQRDVEELAKALTGRSLGPIVDFGRASVGAYSRFQPGRHEPGTRTVLGKVYPQEGEAQAAAILADLAHRPETARHISFKLARHFAGENPPPSLVDRLTNDFLKTGGDLPSLYRCLVESEETWVPGPITFKTPWDWMVSSLRALGVPEQPKPDTTLKLLGQSIWRPGVPAGWSDVGRDWVSPDGLLARVTVAQKLAQKVEQPPKAADLASQILPASLSVASTAQLARAESLTSALALFLVTPEFLRR